MKQRGNRTGTNSIRLALFFLIVAILSLAALTAIFIDTYFLGSLRTVGIKNDPRWRVFDFHSRQASESEIYNPAEIPSIKKVEGIGKRRLRFIFHPPYDKSGWKILDARNGQVIHHGPQAEILFPDFPDRRIFRLIPENMTSTKDIVLEIDFYPGEKYREKNLSWKDNYWLVNSSIPLTPKRPFSTAEWVGLKENDPELEEAKRILGPRIDPSAPALARSEQVFLFVMEALAGSGGTPDDRLQAASPLETYYSLTQGGKGWCENRALVYYLFANAAGIKTRLIDVAGKFGPLKLTGHYFCESYIPEVGGWIYVDPQFGAARAVHRNGKPLQTLDLKKLFDLGSEKDLTFLLYDESTRSLIPRPAERTNSYLVGDLVIAYKFGYGRAKSFSRIKNFLGYPTLLYATFPVPPLFRLKNCLLGTFVVSAPLTVLFWLIHLSINRGRKSSRTARFATSF